MARPRLSMSRLLAPVLVRWICFLVLAALGRPAAGGHFTASLQANYVVNLDFDTEASGDATCAATGSCSGTSRDDSEDDTKVMAFAGGKRKFRCKLPGRNGTTGTLNKDQREKAETHFRNAKLLPYKGRCWTWRKDYWTYEVCFGRKITQYNNGATTTFTLGEHDAGKDELLPGGGVKQYYSRGTDGRSSEVHYTCGTSAKGGRTFIVTEPAELKYVFTVGGPQFCTWRGNGSRAQDPTGVPMVLSSLLEDLRGGCINMTQGWWTYEYCFPHTLRQYHLQGDLKDPIHTLGTMNGSSATQEVDKVNMTMVRLKPGAAGTGERSGPPTYTRVLEQQLGSGAVCDETGRARRATLHFQCTSNWDVRAETRFVSIREGQLCEYEVMVHSPHLCGHRMLVPALPRGNDVIKCRAEPAGA